MPEAMRIVQTSDCSMNCGGPWAAHHIQSVVIGAVAVLVIVVLLTSAKGWKDVFVGTDGRLSTSKTIAVAWTVVVAWSIATVLVRAIAHGNGEMLGADLHPLSDTYLLLL